ncbi:ferredoxin reductase family protein [Marinobacter sp. VGCF2001]|uniref:ferredoxin reductase family protein n=1 Tax=Marinobacter sp. VGCF2001 TaxID=3417189 RepID=UPI003CEEEB5E
MMRLILPFILLATGLWAWSLTTSSLVWSAYDQSLLLSGWLSIALMSLTMMLALRPAWLEWPMGGLDKIYRTHKWAGILAVAFAAAHWLIEMGDDAIEAVFGGISRLDNLHVSGLIDTMRDAAEDVGEFAIYLLFAMLLITLWRKFPYRYWRYLHRAMPALYLLLAFHAVWLAPLDWWRQPVGWLMAALLTGGSLASLLSLSGRVGKHRQVQGTIAAVETPEPNITEVTVDLGLAWQGHRPGQFALVTFNKSEGSHPFTIANADLGDGRTTFLIKALGDFTRNLANKICVGQSVTVEGPYGCFDFNRRNRKAHQIWIAGGIGITPFLAWLDASAAANQTAPEADLHYCTGNASRDPVIGRLQTLCQKFPGIRLHLHDSSKGQSLSVENLSASEPADARAEVWFCGPVGLGQALERGLKVAPLRLAGFHREAFQFR